MPKVELSDRQKRAEAKRRLKLTPPPPHPVRPPGRTRTLNIDIKEAILECFDLIGGIPSFAKWAERNPSEFYPIFARLAPREVAGNIQVNHSSDASQVISQALEALSAARTQRTIDQSPPPTIFPVEDITMVDPTPPPSSTEEPAVRFPLPLSLYPQSPGPIEPAKD